MMTFWDQVHALRSAALTQWAAAEPCVREAEAFRHVLSRLPIGIREDDVLAGDAGPEWGDVPPGLAPLPVAVRESVAPDAAAVMADRYYIFGGYTPAHTTLDYERIVRQGLQAVRGEVLAFDRSGDKGGTSIRRAMAIALDAVCDWAGRFADLADEQAAKTPDAARRAELQCLAAACRHVPRFPARTFAEALQAIWICHFAVGLSELCQSSLSLGRLDQYLLPLFMAGTAGQKGALEDFFRKLNRYGDPACAINVGGCDAAGRDQFNPLSALLLDTVCALRLPSPLLAARLHEGIPAAVLDRLTSPDLVRLGQPTYYGEIPCREALLERGVPETEVDRWCANSCMGLYMPGEEICDMWGGVVNLLTAMELTLTGGTTFQGKPPIPLRTRARRDYASIEDVLETLASYVDELAAYVVERNRRATQVQAAERPNPFLSALTRDCAERGLDRAGGGARYHTVIIEAFGLVNAADALVALDRVVFRDRSVTLGEVTGALEHNFVGANALRHELLRAPKFGQGVDEADHMARRLADVFVRAVQAQQHDRVVLMPSFHTLNGHIAAGARTPASADGRRAGAPLAKNVGPMSGLGHIDHTTVLLAAAGVGQKRFTGGQAVDISMDAHVLETTRGREALGHLLQTYFHKGGLQVQINGLTVADLQAAMAEPDRHRDMMVRIGGYSARFVDLSKTVQEDMVERLRCGL